MAKVIMKINRYVKHIGADDLILDNGSCIQVTTQKGVWVNYNYAPVQMSKKQFKKLKVDGSIFVDKEKTDQANAKYKTPFLTYYRFDIDKLIENGYPIVEEVKQ